MICFFTSSHCVADAPDLNPANGFVDELRRCLPDPCRALFICSDPDAPAFTDRIARESRESFGLAGFSFSSYSILDRRTCTHTADLIARSDLILLAGGHVPTQNRFFRQIGLSEHIRCFRGVVVAVSAGSMNCAQMVYAQPEEPGESFFPRSCRFLPGLGLTSTMLLPHYQLTRNNRVDGLRLYEEITLPDSMGQCFYALEDGSYLFSRNGREELRGTAFRIRDGVMTRISRDGDVVPLPEN